MKENQIDERKNEPGYSVKYDKSENEEYMKLFTRKLIDAMRDN